MQIRETIDNPSTASIESPPEDVITLVDSAGVALGVQHAVSAKTRAVGPGGVSIASRWWKFRWSDLRGKIIGELAKDFSRRPLEDVASLIADA